MGFKLQMSWQATPPSQKRKNGPPLGLKNLGNSCYLNSVLQCLTYTPPLANFCLNLQHSSLCDSILDGVRKRDCPFCILEKRIARSLSVDLTLDAPNKILNCLKIFSEHFKFGRQEDAHEFLRYVIDACHNTCLRLKKLRRKGADAFNGNTVVKEIFGGALQSQVKCLSCGMESNKVDEIMDISLDILHSSSLKESMQKFFQPEILDGNNKYRCENCKKLVAARKQMSVLRAPNILVIQLKRFEGIFGGKIDKAIAFEEVLVLSRFMSKTSQDPQPEYNLFGTIVHSGFSPESGHYYAYIKDAMCRWYCCNDSFVSLSTLQEVLSEKVYILFFCRTNQRPASASNGVKSHDFSANEVSKPQKAATALKGVTMKQVENSVQKDASRPLKGEKLPSGPRLRFNISKNPSAKRAPQSINGKLSVQKKRIVTNGVSKDSLHVEKNGKDVSPSISKSGSNMNKKFSAVNTNGKRAEENGSPFSPCNNSAKLGLPVATATDSSVKGGKGHEHRKLDSDGLKSQSDAWRSKRKSKENSCILLGQDAQSRERVEELKEILKKDASSFLRSCGWYEKVHGSMRSKKRLCGEGGNRHGDDDLKGMLIADAKAAFNSQIPESLKAELVERLMSFSQDKQYPGS